MTVRTLRVANVDKHVLDRLIREHHYSGTCSAIKVGYGVWYEGRLRGGIVFSTGVGRYANAHCRVCQSAEIIELTRLWLSDEIPTNAESRVLGVALRHLRKARGPYRAVLSYADEYAGHAGTIYQATNWYYMGSTNPSGTKVRVGDQVINARSFNGRYGTHSIPKLRAIFGRDDIDYIRVESRKHAYVYPLDESVRPWLAAHARPYPKRAPEVLQRHARRPGGRGRCDSDPGAPH